MCKNRNTPVNFDGRPNDVQCALEATKKLNKEVNKKQFCGVADCKTRGEPFFVNGEKWGVMCSEHWFKRGHYYFSDNCTRDCLTLKTWCEHTKCTDVSCKKRAQHTVWTRNAAGMPIMALACKKHAVPRYVAPIVYSIPGLAT